MKSLSLFLEDREEEGRKAIPEEKQTETPRKLSFETIKVKKGRTPERQGEIQRGRERKRERDSENRCLL